MKLIGVSIMRCHLPFERVATKSKLGKTSNVKIVDETIPPITTVANGRCTSEPVPCDIAIGMNPNEATSAVMSTGRRRITAPSRIADRGDRLSGRSFCINVTSTSPFKTETPHRAIKPTAADIERGIPRNHNAMIPPDSANGMPEYTSNVFFNDLKVRYTKENTVRSTTGMTILSLDFAFIRCSYCPSHPNQ